MNEVTPKYPVYRNPIATRASSALYDKWLLLIVLSLVFLGLVMVASASVVVSEKQFHQPFYYLFRQMVYFTIGLLLASWLIRIRLETWQKAAPFVLFFSLFLLFLVLIPGIGRHLNGSARWIGFGPIGLQVSELYKFSLILFLADYLSRRQDEVQNSIIGFLKPMGIIGIASLLLLKEPDFGATAVTVTTALGMMFLAGVPYKRFTWLFGAVLGVLAIIAISSPYRMERLTVFLNPWASQYDGGYQLTQALIAFGRGGWTGVGLGNSIQKLFYLPEAHTDFVFAVFAEEMGFIGVIFLVSLFCLFVWRALEIGRKAEKQNALFSAYLAYGLSLWIGMQAMINMGVNSGLLPTKGLTLPLVSYGGSSLIIMVMALAFLFRVDYESRLAAIKNPAKELL